MNRTSANQSVTADKWKQFETSRQLLKDFKEEFPSLISKKDYRDALKMHRKIELGFRNKFGIVIMGAYYSLLYLDVYFLKYIGDRFFKFIEIK